MLRLENVLIEQGPFRLTADFTVKEGAITALIGPSGAGKSSLLSLIGGFYQVNQGRIFIGGRDVTDLPPSERSIASLFQDGNLFPHLTVVENIALGLRPSGRIDAQEAAQVRDVIASVGLEGMGERKPAELSGGQQSRVALARVLLQNKDVVLLDEPFSALGPALRIEMLDLVKERLAGRTILMVTHDPEDAKRVADQVIVVMRGEATQPVPTRDLFEVPTDALREYLGH